MGKAATTKQEIKEIKRLRTIGYSIPEIVKVVGRGKSTVFRYVQNVDVLPEFILVLKSKQGGSITRSKNDWNDAKKKAEMLISGITQREKLIALSCLYWGEGNKKEFNFINSNPFMVRVFVECLSIVGIEKNTLKFSIRIYEDISKNKVLSFWSNVLEIPKSQIGSIDVLKGKKKGKLPNGMCRVRATKGGKSLKLVRSMIDLLKSEIIPAAVVQWIEQDTPNV